MKTHLLIIDPQMDFCDHPGFGAALAVPGAHADMQRLAAMVKAAGPSIEDIHVTLDSHHVVDIAHPIWWKDKNGNAPNPFTVISEDDVANGVWTARSPAYKDLSERYVKSLAASGKYALCIWPEHCIIGSAGHSIHPDLLDSLKLWDRTNFAAFETLTKGSNPTTEHYSAVMAEVPDPTDPSTQLNTPFIETLAKADLLLVAGEALSHCVASTMRDVVAQFGKDQLSKIAILEDATSSVGGLEKLGEDFINEMTGMGVRLMRTTDFARGGQVFGRKP